MNDLNRWENQMSGWKPRGPSARLERRIFAAPQPAPAGNRAGDTVAEALGWFCNLRHAGWTAAGTALLALTLVNADLTNGRFLASEGGLPILTALSNQSWSACFAMAQVTHNDWSAPILSWTNEGPFHSTNRSLVQLNTNLLTPKL